MRAENHKKRQARQKKHTQQGMKQIFDFMLKIGEKDVLMCAKFESSTMNSTNVIEDRNLYL